jgi:hypothetical protein
VRTPGREGASFVSENISTAIIVARDLGMLEAIGFGWRLNEPRFGFRGAGFFLRLGKQKGSRETDGMGSG